jgi:hypothetical protein
MATSASEATPRRCCAHLIRPGGTPLVETTPDTAVHGLFALIRSSSPRASSRHVHLTQVPGPPVPRCHNCERWAAQVDQRTAAGVRATY